MLLRILATCPGTDWTPGQVVQATPEQATQWSDGVHAAVVRDMPTERAASAVTAPPGVSAFIDELR